MNDINQANDFLAVDEEMQDFANDLAEDIKLFKVESTKTTQSILSPKKGRNKLSSLPKTRITRRTIRVKRPKFCSKKKIRKITITVDNVRHRSKEDLKSLSKTSQTPFYLDFMNLSPDYNKEMLDFSPGKERNNWRMIYNSLFNKQNCKGSLMKKFLESQKKPKSPKKGGLKSPTRSKRLLSLKERSATHSPDGQDDKLSTTMKVTFDSPENPVKPTSEERGIDHFTSVKKVAKMRQRIDELSKDFRLNFKQFRGLINAQKEENATRNYFQQTKIRSKIKAEIVAHNQTIKLRMMNRKSGPIEMKPRRNLGRTCGTIQLKRASKIASKLNASQEIPKGERNQRTFQNQNEYCQNEIKVQKKFKHIPESTMGTNQGSTLASLKESSNDYAQELSIDKIRKQRSFNKVQKMCRSGTPSQSKDPRNTLARLQNMTCTNIRGYKRMLNTTNFDKTLKIKTASTFKSTIRKNAKRRMRSRGSKEFSRLMKNIKNEPDSELRKLMQRTISNIKLNRSQKSTTRAKNSQNCNFLKKICVTKYHDKLN
ncbi:unnamed protein product [Moneuplotes crassus]|uniref:Uncharacterized protein n=1 Tax=Euplotes crassus TaxID=5936 RepID=A0AAD1X4K9_EUPCR|nr:unnamed protein product [Moneuplotes crassus]